MHPRGLHTFTLVEKLAGIIGCELRKTLNFPPFGFFLLWLDLFWPFSRGGDFPARPPVRIERTFFPFFLNFFFKRLTLDRARVRTRSSSLTVP